MAAELQVWVNKHLAASKAHDTAVIPKKGVCLGGVCGSRQQQPKAPMWLFPQLVGDPTRPLQFQGVAQVQSGAADGDPDGQRLHSSYSLPQVAASAQWQQ